MKKLKKHLEKLKKKYCKRRVKKEMEKKIKEVKEKYRLMNKSNMNYIYDLFFYKSNITIS